MVICWAVLVVPGAVAVAEVPTTPGTGRGVAVAGVIALVESGGTVAEVTVTVALPVEGAATEAACNFSVSFAVMTESNCLARWRYSLEEGSSVED